MDNQPRLEPEDQVDELNVEGQPLESVHGQNVRLNQSSAQTITGQQVTISGGGVQNVDAVEVKVEQGGALFVRGQAVSLAQSGAGFVVADSANLKGQSFIAGLVANRIQAEKPRVIFLLARAVEGEVQAIFDAKGAFTFGAALGAVIGLALLIRNRGNK